jgi:hypothetical protein
MAALKLPTEQAEYMAERLSWKAQGIAEEKLGALSDTAAADVLATWDEMAPLVEAIRDLSEKQQASNLDLVAEVAGDALKDHRDSVGYELAVRRRIEAGEVVQWLAGDDRSADDAIERCEKEADRQVAQADLAWSILEAVRQSQDEAKANAGDPRAQESLAVRQRWADENRRLAAEAVSA